MTDQDHLGAVVHHIGGGHLLGPHRTGIVAAEADNGIGIAGIAFAAIANGLPAKMGILGVVAALGVHIFNFGISVFSPTIHSLRLNLVEFLPKFYENPSKYAFLR